MKFAKFVQLKEENESMIDVRQISPLKKDWKEIEDDGLQQICSQRDTQQIIKIFADSNKITVKGIRCMGRYKWTNLTDLSLGGNKIGIKGCKYLSQIPMSQLNYLNLSYCGIGNQGITHLTKASWDSLKQISLKQSRIGCSGIKAFLKIKPQLRIVSIRYNKICFEELRYLLLLQSEQIAQIYIKNSLINKQQQGIVKKHLQNKFTKTKIY